MRLRLQWSAGLGKNLKYLQYLLSLLVYKVACRAVLAGGDVEGGVNEGGLVSSQPCGHYQHTSWHTLTIKILSFSLFQINCPAMAANINHNAEEISQTEQQPSCTVSSTVSNHCNPLHFSSFISFLLYHIVFFSYIAHSNSYNKSIWKYKSLQYFTFLLFMSPSYLFL